MRCLISLLLACLLLSSCRNNKKQTDNERNILGDWVKVKKKHKYNPDKFSPEDLELPDFYTPGFTFYSNHTFDNKFSYIKTGGITSLSSISRYKIIGDSLLLFNPDSNKWYGYKLIKLTPDSLQFVFNDQKTTFKHFYLTNYKNPEADKIILSTSGCYGECPVSNTIVDADGSMIFMGEYNTLKKGLYTATISQKTYRKLADNFAKANFDSLKKQVHSTLDR